MDYSRMSSSPLLGRWFRGRDTLGVWVGYTSMGVIGMGVVGPSDTLVTQSGVR